MFRLKKWLPCLAVLVGAAILEAPTQARADFELRVSTNGGTDWTTYSSTNGGISWTNVATSSNVGNSVFVDSLSITANSTDYLSGQISSMDLGVGGQQQANQNYDILVQTSVTGVPTAPPPQILNWKFTSSSDLSGLNETAESWVSSSNNLFVTSGTTVVADTGSVTAPSTGKIDFSASPPYSWTEQYSLSGSGSAGNTISADFNGQITTPEPASMMAALSAVPFLALGAWLRRRKQVAIA